MSYGRTIEYLYGLQKYGMKFGLDNTRRLMAALGNPQNSFRSVHVAGTNGKGSTSAMIAAILRTGGIRTGLFTSPHLLSFTERIRVDGSEISEDQVIELADMVRRSAEKQEDFSPTFFEVVTSMAFVHFRSMQTGWAVVEVGMGGRLDATNILSPEVSVITSISLDHREFLGSTLREIAREKAGIIKDGVPVVSAGQDPDVAAVLGQAASEHGSTLHRYGDTFAAELTAWDIDGISLHYHGDRDLRDLRVPLAGEHQLVNAAVAIKTAELIMKRSPDIHCDIRQGLLDTAWPGRLEFVHRPCPVLIDGAHNPAAARTLAGYLERLLQGKYRRIIFVIGIMADKDIEGILRPLLPLASECIFAAPAYGRAAAPAVLAAYARTLGHASQETSGVAEALSRAEGLCLPGDLVVITGSFYTIGEAKEALGQRGVLARLRE